MPYTLLRACDVTGRECKPTRLLHQSSDSADMSVIIVHVVTQLTQNIQPGLIKVYLAHHVCIARQWQIVNLSS